MPPSWAKKKKPPKGYEYIEPTLEALENELRDRVKDTNEGKRKAESLWPIHQINWQKSRYIYDMFYTHKRISRSVYDYCINQKLVDSSLIAKWKKPGYEWLCSTYVINPSNYKFGTTSICRVPLSDRSEDARMAQDPTTGCRGCASGKGAGPRNIFGRKYGQNLAAVQLAREKRLEDLEKKRREVEEQNRKQQQEEDGEDETDDDGEEETDEEDYGPSPTAGVWAGTKRLQTESEKIADDKLESDDEGPMPKKQRND